jgi:hypothetical protein
MQKILLALFSATLLWSCDYSTSSNGNIDAAFAREEKAPSAHESAPHGGHDATGHKDEGAKDHMETHGSQGENNPKVLPTDTIETEHTEHH